MKPVEVEEKFEGAHHVVYAKDQPEYQPLPAVQFDDGRVVTEWELTDDERAALAGGANLRLWLWTFSNPLQPVALQVVGVEVEG